MIESWTCPSCQRLHARPPQDASVIVTLSLDKGLARVFRPRRAHQVRLEMVGCAACASYEVVAHHAGFVLTSPLIPNDPKALHTSTLLFPASQARTFPDYVPAQIREDYAEACAIAQASPKAAASLARRALQGMIRDAWKITGQPTLWHEIDALKDEPSVPPATWKAIDAVRKVGNIGAHMERDIDVIVDVEPHEATALIELIEMLIEEWYVARQRRQEHLARVKQIGDLKDGAKSAAGRASSPEGAA